MKNNWEKEEWGGGGGGVDREGALINFLPLKRWRGFIRGRGLAGEVGGLRLNRGYTVRIFFTP